MSGNMTNPIAEAERQIVAILAELEAKAGVTITEVRVVSGRPARPDEVGDPSRRLSFTMSHGSPSLPWGGERRDL